MSKYHWLAVALFLGIVAGLAPAVSAEETPEESGADVSYLLTPYAGTVPAEWAVFAGSPRSVYFQRVIEAAKLRNDMDGVEHLERLAAAPPAIPPDLTPEMNRYHPSYAAIYHALQQREKNAMTYKDYPAVDQWRVDQTEADLQLVAWELQKGGRASTSFMEKYLRDAAWALNHHIEVHPRVVAAEAPTARLSLSANSIERGQCATLSWQTTNANQSTLNGEAVSSNGSRQVCPDQNASYLLAAVGAGGRAEDRENLAVTLPALTVYRIHFDFDEEAIRADAVDTMRKVAGLLRENPDLRMTLSGHTDAKGSGAYNLALGERRAKSVRDYFLAHFGLSPLRFDMKSKGEAEPIAPNTTQTGRDNPNGRALNRRAEFIELR